MGLSVAVLAATCLPWHGHGGLERHVFELCTWLRRRDVDVDLYTSAPEHEADPFAGDPGFRLRIVPGTPFSRRRFAVVISRSTLYPVFSLRMGKVVAESGKRYDAVIAQGLAGFGYALYGSRAASSAPLILNPHGMEETVSSSAAKKLLYAPFRAFTRFAAARAAAVVATDDVLVDRVERALGVPRSAIVVIPNAVDVERCRSLVDHERGERVKRRLGVESAAPLAVTVGRLAPNKGLEVGMAALARVCGEMPPSWRWLIVGEGSSRAELEQAARRHGIAEHVRFAGSLEDADLHNVLAAADLFLAPTLYEGSSLVTLEAMSHAAAIVASRTGGIPDKIEEGVTGWLAEPGDVDSLAGAIGRCWAAGDEARTRIGRAAAERCRERFDWPAAADRYVEIIRKLAS